MFSDPKGPIEHFSWGHFRIDGVEHAKKFGRTEGAGKDIRVIGREVTTWKERKGHVLEPEMITGIQDQGIEVLVIGIGVNSDIQVPEETRQAIRNTGIEEIILAPTPEACQAYNQLIHQGKKVALLAHGTC